MTLDKSTLVALLLGMAIAGTAGWTANGWRHETTLSNLKSTYATAEKKAAEDHAVALAQANARGDRLMLAQAAMEITHNEVLREKNNEITRLATGRRCLDAGVVGVLNRDGAATNGRPVPEAAGGAVRADGGAAAGADDGQAAEHYATDADVAGWIALCQSRYATCRGRLDGLRRFYEGGSADE